MTGSTGPMNFQTHSPTGEASMQETEQKPQASAATMRDRLIRIADVEGITGIRKTTIYAMMKTGRFPRCVQVTPRCVAWPESSVQAWVKERIEEASTKHAAALARMAPAQACSNG